MGQREKKKTLKNLLLSKCASNSGAARLPGRIPKETFALAAGRTLQHQEPQGSAAPAPSVLQDPTESHELHPCSSCLGS